jgi:hypothetical protein
MSLVPARWLPGYSAQLPDGRVVNHGDVVDMPDWEAEASGNWEPVEKPKVAEKSGGEK